MRQYAQRVADGDVLHSPLDTLLEVMRHFLSLAIEHERRGTVLVEGVGETAKPYTPTQLRLLAMDAAAKAAPFAHPKLAAIDATVASHVTLEDALLELAVAGDDGTGDPSSDSGPAASYSPR